MGNCAEACMEKKKEAVEAVDPVTKKETSYMVGAKSTTPGFDDIFDAPKHQPVNHAENIVIQEQKPANAPLATFEKPPKATITNSELVSKDKPSDDKGRELDLKFDSSRTEKRDEPPKVPTFTSDIRRSDAQPAPVHDSTPNPIVQESQPMAQQSTKPFTTATTPQAQTTIVDPLTGASAADYVQDLQLADECFYTGEAVNGVPQGHGTLTSYSSSYPATTSCTRGASARGRCTARALCRSSTTTSDTPAT